MIMTIVTLVLAFALGIVAALLYYAVLRWHVRAILGYAMMPSLIAPLLRMAILIGAFGLAVTHGAWALLACAAGFLLVRAIVLRHVKG